MVGHYFVSYSRVDAVGFTENLADQLLAGDPSYRSWVDRREIAAGQDWDEEIAEAIQTCLGVLFVLSPDSVRATSGCRNEVAWALKYKKPVIPLRLHPDADLPFRLSARQYIDFSDDGDKGLARLRLLLVESASPAGVLRELRYRLADAERELPRARDAQRLRVEQEVQVLRRQFDKLERQARDPQAVATGREPRVPGGAPF